MGKGQLWKRDSRGTVVAEHLGRPMKGGGRRRVAWAVSISGSFRRTTIQAWRAAAGSSSPIPCHHDRPPSAGLPLDPIRPLRRLSVQDGSG